VIKRFAESNAVLASPRSESAREVSAVPLAVGPSAEAVGTNSARKHTTVLPARCALRVDCTVSPLEIEIEERVA
jgi:acetylornithine deacetylase/succinyl-diaminopimelate desuccinylase-like protein